MVGRRSIVVGRRRVMVRSVAVGRTIMVGRIGMASGYVRIRSTRTGHIDMTILELIVFKPITKLTRGEKPLGTCDSAAAGRLVRRERAQQANRKSGQKPSPLQQM